MESRTCFEIFGFDIILDSKMQPLLLEVNQAPSFATDSPLDYEIKRKLFVDMFSMLNLTIARKKEKLQQQYQEKLDRMTSRLSLKEKNKLKRQQMQDVQYTLD